MLLSKNKDEESKCIIYIPQNYSIVNKNSLNAVIQQQKLYAKTDDS
jgi:hypothetical protein